MKNKVLLFVACVVASQIIAAWLCFVSGIKFGTPDAGWLFGFSLIWGIAGSVAIIGITSSSDV